MSSEDPSIEACGLGKTFALYDRPEDRLKQMLWPGRKRFYREFVAVRDVDLQVARGECVGIVGRNGSGKSTLLKMICGTLAPSSGEVQLRGRVAPILALGAGFSPEFTGRENVLLNGMMLGQSRRETIDRIQTVIDFADIGDFFDQPVKRYSSGMYSRLAFAAAIATRPEILVMDEVLAVGDEAFTRKCFARIEEIKAEGATILFASHAPNLVVELCDRAILMDAGECLLEADPKTVITHHQRLLFTPPGLDEDVRNEIRILNFEGDCGVSEQRADKADLGSVPNTAINDPVDYGRFDPEMRPESTVQYGRGTAQIENLRILTPDGVAVNILKPGLEYRYAYDVLFLEAARGVRFGMMMRLVTGFELGGQTSHSPGQAVGEIDAGTRMQVDFSFVANLVPGTYFLNAGVLALMEGEETYLHRIVDGAMFKLLPTERTRLTGQVDISGAAEVSFRPIPQSPFEGQPATIVGEN
jgi:lipopolysaccharide transport system ATP-binding protein